MLIQQQVKKLKPSIFILHTKNIYVHNECVYATIFCLMFQFTTTKIPCWMVCMCFFVCASSYSLLIIDSVAILIACFTQTHTHTGTHSVRRTHTQAKTHRFYSFFARPCSLTRWFSPLTFDISSEMYFYTHRWWWCGQTGLCTELVHTIYILWNVKQISSDAKACSERVYVYVLYGYAQIRRNV